MASSSSTGKLPSLINLQPIEADAVMQCFRLYDYHATGRIPKHLAIKLMEGKLTNIVFKRYHGMSAYGMCALARVRLALPRVISSQTWDTIKSRLR
jgi:hypothetical protein